MFKYCIDTSGLSNPLETLPEDIFSSLWDKIRKIMLDGKLCCNSEILEELNLIDDAMGEFLKVHAPSFVWN